MEKKSRPDMHWYTNRESDNKEVFHGIGLPSLIKVKKFIGD